MVSTGDLIQLLPDYVANQIAAGEVVQRPASVVKELMENAVDAGADSIDLIVRDAGRSLIQVVDNGKGMSVTDLRMAFERHATSKIRTTEDIFHIHTKGFRGEALASIAAVAQVDTLSKLKDEKLGNQLIIEGGIVRDQIPAATPDGTSISVKNLFYNVPARRNFLKSNQVELRHIQDEFMRVALAHENIDFRFFHNKSEVYILRSGNLKQRIVQIFGRKMEGKLVPVKEETEVVKLSGYIGKPEAARKKRGEQFFFVNHRYIRSGYLHKAIMDAFEDLLSNGYFPAYWLYLEIDPTKIDINIHPTKTEIKFEDEYAIYAILRSAVKHALGQFSITPTLDFDQDPDIAFLPSAPKGKQINPPNIRVDRNYNPFEQKPSKSQIRGTENLYHSISEFEAENREPETILSPREMNLFDSDVFQWKNEFLVTTYRGELLIINQNRAHQLVLYEKLKKLGRGNGLSQRLLFPTEIPLSASEINSLKIMELQLVNFGFDMEFEKEKVNVIAIPPVIETGDIQAVFTEFLKEIETHNTVNFETEIAKIIAKNSAVRKGQLLQKEQAQNLIKELLELENPAYSPFGKPVFIQIGEEEILKKLN